MPVEPNAQFVSCHGVSCKAAGEFANARAIFASKQQGQWKCFLSKSLQAEARSNRVGGQLTEWSLPGRGAPA